MSFLTSRDKRSVIETVAKRWGINPSQFKIKKGLVEAIDLARPVPTELERFISALVEDGSMFIASPNIVYGYYLVEFGEAAKLTRDEMCLEYRKALMGLSVVYLVIQSFIKQVY